MGMLSHWILLGPPMAYRDSKVCFWNGAVSSMRMVFACNACWNQVKSGNNQSGISNVWMLGVNWF